MAKTNIPYVRNPDGTQGEGLCYALTRLLMLTHPYPCGEAPCLYCFMTLEVEEMADSIDNREPASLQAPREPRRAAARRAT